MRMQVMSIRHMWVHMSQGLMSMYVAVLSRWHIFVSMQMVPIVMRMGVLVLQVLVFMLMTV